LKACRAPAAGVLLGSVVLALSACSGSVSKDDLKDSESILTGLTVSGRPGTEPIVRMRTPLTVEETTSGVVVTGPGAPVQVDQLFVLELTLYDARTGKKAISTYDTGSAIAAKTSDDRLFPALSQALVGVRQGSRLVLAATAADAFATGGVPPAGVDRSDPVVVVADVVAVPPQQVLPSPEGTPVSHVPRSPDLAYQDGVPFRLDFSLVERPPERRAYIRVLGTGPVVTAHSLVTVNYIAQRSTQQYPFDNTFLKEPVELALGTGTAPAVFDKYLVGLHRGSRLLIYGPDKDGMIAWVVDVLGVS